MPAPQKAMLLCGVAGVSARLSENYHDYFYPALAGFKNG